jgi:hypothetical protein
MPKIPKSFAPDANQLARGIEHICYEYANLMSAAYWDMNGSAPWRTHADDAFLLGYRKLGDFLLAPNRSKLQGQELPDILASDYLPLGCTGSWTLPTWAKEWREPMNKQFAHLSYLREKVWVHYDWIPQLVEEFRIAWQEFLHAIDPKYKLAFEAEIEKCRRKPGFEGIRL